MVKNTESEYANQLRRFRFFFNIFWALIVLIWVLGVAWAVYIVHKDKEQIVAHRNEACVHENI